jgi:beta-N-acetylhexosaminidase
MNRKIRLVFVVVWLLNIFTTSTVSGQDQFNYSESYQKALQLAEKLSPEEKVGQLFLITFDGSAIETDSEIYDLISKHYIGGVVLRSENVNFPDSENTLQKISSLITRLQTIAWEDRKDLAELPKLNLIDEYIPLFIGISQYGGSYPYDQIINGLSSIPSQMAIGATWNTSAAGEVGRLVGSELELIGINMLFGPSLDVLDVSYSKEKEYLGVRTFGGDPYWVGEMGAAYVEGIHKGSRNKVAVIARNFPGIGSSDRLPNEEVSTVRKSIEQLQLIELAPFFRVTETAGLNESHIVEGLFSSHIRYQGFQGNIRATTKPISFDQNAMEQLMNLAPINVWRDSMGVLVSDDLGSLAVQRFYDPSGNFIDARQVIRNAFLAGNDLLYVDQLKSTGDIDRFDTYRNTIDLFVQKYKEDQAFAEKVDESLLRILTLKFDLYKEFSLANVVPDSDDLFNEVNNQQIAFDVALQAATIINPTQIQFTDAFPSPPQFGEEILIFTDDQSIKLCEECTAEEIFPVDGLQTSILNLYGPDGSSQIGAHQITSYSFDDLLDYVDNPFNRPELEENLSKAKWVIFVLREINPEQPSSYALHNLLEKNPSILREKNILVFSFDAPYYFDATEISAFSAYYCLYSKLPQFVEVAARILFQELSPQGASPVSIPGIAYDLISVVTPIPDQVIPLSVDEETAKSLLDELGAGQEEEESELDPTDFKLGDTLPVITGIIVDHNNNPVPDGTVVQFTMSEQGTTTIIQQIESTTKNGIAKASVVLQNAGLHEIRVSSEPALISQILILDISEEEAIVSAIYPTPIPISDDAGDVTETIVEPPVTLIEKENNKISEWLIATILSWIFGIAAFFLFRNLLPVSERVRISLTTVIGGLFNTMWMILDLPGSPLRYGMNGYLRLSFSVFIGVVIGGSIGWLITWNITKNQSQKNRTNKT